MKSIHFLMGFLDSDDGVLLPKTEKHLRKGVLMQRNWFRSFVAHLFPESRTRIPSLDFFDCVLVIVFLFVGTLSRVIRIQYPKNVVFEENVCGFATNHYLRGVYFEDRHPPLPHLILSGIAKFAGYDASYTFSEGEAYRNMFYVMLRLIPAFFGSVCVPLSYLLMRLCHVSALGSATAALIIAIEPMLIIESRHYKSEAILHFFTIIALCSIALFKTYKTFSMFVLECVCLGLALACKSTAGGLVILVILEQFPLHLFRTKVFWRQSGTAITKSCILISIIVIIHLMIYSIHLTILPFKGQNVQGPSVITDYLVDVSKPNWVERSRAPSVVIRAMALFWHNHKLSMNVRGSSPYTSKWWTWAFAIGKWINVWDEGQRHLVCFGNPLIWIPVVFGVISNVLRALIENDWKSDLSSMLIGYCFSYFPFMFVDRDLFVYHYTIPLLLGIFQLVMIIDRIHSSVVRGFLFFWLMNMAIFGFMIWNPLVYGKIVKDFEFLVWYKGWVRDTEL